MSFIEIVTPAPLGSLQGNRFTALRWQRFIKKLGHHSLISEKWSGEESDLLIVLHAYRSHDSILRFKKKYRQQPVILIITGTDLYRDMATHHEVLESMEMADYIVVLQNTAIQSIPEHLRFKTRVIYQSVRSITRKPLAKRSFLISVIGHLRPEKDPFCIARSLAYLKTDSAIRIKHLGKAMSSDMAKMALAYKNQLDRYQWLGEKTHGQTLQLLSRSHLLVISSLMEGGAHVVSEAISIGVPVIASDIPGNRGLLGENYPGYYPVQNDKELAILLEKAETNSRFYHSLEKHIQSRRKLVDPNLELHSIQVLLDHALG